MNRNKYILFLLSFFCSTVLDAAYVEWTFSFSYDSNKGLDLNLYPSIHPSTIASQEEKELCKIASNASESFSSGVIEQTIHYYSLYKNREAIIIKCEKLEKDEKEKKENTEKKKLQRKKMIKENKAQKNQLNQALQKIQEDQKTVRLLLQQMQKGKNNENK